jgi:hypothetical protein
VEGEGKGGGAAGEARRRGGLFPGGYVRMEWFREGDMAIPARE